MSKIFLSYRRDDSADATGRLYDRLAAHYSGENIFRDVDTIPLGVDFRTHLHEAVGRCGVLLAIIGRQWLSVTHSAGQRRLDDPRDFVRIEIEAALQRNIPVIPVLVQGAAMPVAEDLPPSLQLLAFRNGIAVRPDPDFHRDVDRLIQHLDRLFTAAPPAAVPASPQPQPRPQPRSAASPKQLAEQKARELAGEDRFAEAVQELLQLPPALRSLTLLDDLREQWRTQVHDEVNRLATAHDYAAAAEALEKLPPELRDAELLASCQSRRDRLEQLREEIHADWQANRKDFLREKVDEYLKLNPNDDDMVRLYQKLPKVEREIVNSIGMKFVLVRPGSFLMGSPDSEPERQADEKQHRVEITRPFYLGVFQVTQEEYQKVMGGNPSHFTGDKRRPVEQVSWEVATEFCRKLSNLPEEKKRGRLYRLPTEAEWEYSCREGGTSLTPFHFGSSLHSSQANFDGNYPYGGVAKGRYLQKTAPVGSYKPNALGLYDMHGNLWEWCLDWYDDEEDYYNSSPQQNPQGPQTGSHRVLRGGSWGNKGRNCRAACRDHLTPGIRSNMCGFRVLLVAGARTP